jgi:hypothetical protein
MPAASNNRSPEWIAEAIASDPAFRVLTMDGVNWLDPYTGDAIPAPFGHEDVASKYLLERRPWLLHKPKPLLELLTLRWRHYLRMHLEFIENLRIFRHGKWLNPYTGAWVAGITLVNHEITAQTIDDLSRVLGACVEAQSGKMLEKFRIDILVSNGPEAASASSGRIATRSAKELKPTRDRTDFHHVKRQFVKMLSRPPRLDGYQLVMHYEPFSVIPRNFYDFISLDRNRLLIVIGDVTGQGPGAALIAGQVMRTLRRLGAMRAELIDLVASLNDELRLDLVPGSALTMFAAVLNLPFNSLTCLSLGFSPAALINPRRELRLQQICTDGAALGRIHGQRFRDTLRPISIQLRPGDLVVLSTDGLARGHNLRDAAAGHLAVMGSCLSHVERPFVQLLGQVVDEAKRGYNGAVTDDLTMVGIRFKTGDEPQTGRIVQQAKPVVPVAKPSARKHDPTPMPGPPSWLDSHED